MKHMEMDSARKVRDRVGVTSALAPVSRMIAVAVAIVWLPASMLGATNNVSSPAGFVRLTIAPQTNLFASMPFVAVDPAICANYQIVRPKVV